jgi:hypothetical protein
MPAGKVYDSEVDRLRARGSAEACRDGDIRSI